MKNRELLKTGKKPAPGELALIQGLINTADLEDGTDDWATPAQLKGWLVRHGLLHQSVPVTDADLKTMIVFRESVRQLLATNQDRANGSQPAKRLNRLTGDCSILVKFNGKGGVSLQPSDRGTWAALERLLAIVIQATADGTWSHLKICQASTCRWAFYDISKNHSGRWCSMSICGSRAKARQYRKRQPQGHD